MNSRFVPRLMLIALAAAAAGPVSAQSLSSAPLRVERVDDATLAGLTGKFFGADMLVGVRIDLVSTLASAQGATASATGSLYIRRTGGGYEVRMDSRAGATPGSGDAPASANVATGGDALRVDGIGQVTQIAGNGNRMANVALIRIGAAPAAPAGFNDQAGAQAEAGGLRASVSFVGGGVQLGLVAPGATIGQQVAPGAAGQVMQTGRIAGDGFTASNTLQLQMMTAAMPAASLQQLGIQQALSALSGLRR